MDEFTSHIGEEDVVFETAPPGLGDVNVDGHLPAFFLLHIAAVMSPKAVIEKAKILGYVVYYEVRSMAGISRATMLARSFARCRSYSLFEKGGGGLCHHL